ncbi:MAG: hypothetical protein HYX92_05365 [Chloroflexi bacterium]|nr:hypothetical protein [Chloroflexota bacterium]
MSFKNFALLISCFTILAVVLPNCSTPRPREAQEAIGAAKVLPTSQTLVPTPAPKGTQSPQYGGILTVSTNADPVMFDMHQTTTLVTHVTQLAYNGIIQVDPNNPESLISDLAKSWEVSKDGLSYMFQLNDGVKFHNGTPFTAADVQVSFQRQINPPKGVLAPRRPDFERIDRVETPDMNTVKFILKYPSSSILDLISSGTSVIYSKAFLEEKGDMKKDVMGTGPFKLKSYSAGSVIEYVKNSSYFVKDRPYMDGVNFYVLGDPSTKLAAFRTGRVKHIAPSPGALTPAQADLIKRNLPEAVIMPYDGFHVVNFIMNIQQKPWDDIRVRKAVHLAIDRQAAITVLKQGYARLGSNMAGAWGIPQDELLKMPGWRQPKDADISEAKRLLAEAGFPNGFREKSLTRAEPEYANVAVFMADQLAKIGVQLELDVREVAVRTSLLNQGSFTSHSTMNSLMYADPDNLVRYWGRPLRDDWGMNWQRANDEKIWDLFDRQSREIDPVKRREMVRELDLRMIDSAMKPIIIWNEEAVAMWPEVKNRGKLLGRYNNNRYQDVWLAK